MDVRAALEQAVHRFGEAWANGDVATLESLLSPTYLHTDAYGKAYAACQQLAAQTEQKPRLCG